MPQALSQSSVHRNGQLRRFELLATMTYSVMNIFTFQYVLLANLVLYIICNVIQINIT